MLFHHLCKTVEQIVDVVRAGAGLGVALETERGAIGAGKALQAPVKKRHVRDTGRCGQGLHIDGEAVILARDHDASRLEILHGMVRAVMPEFHLEGLRAACEAQQLMSQANPEHGNARLEQAPNRPDRVITGFGIARTVREKDAIGLQSKRLFRRRLRRQHGHAEQALALQPAARSRGSREKQACAEYCA